MLCNYLYITALIFAHLVDFFDDFSHLLILFRQGDKPQPNIYQCFIKSADITEKIKGVINRFILLL